MINWFNQNAGAVQAISTTVLVMITGFYAYWTKRSAVLFEKSEKKRSEPKVLAHLESSDDWISLVYLVIGNYGRDVAYNVKFSVDQDFGLIHDGKKLTDLRPIAKGIKSLTPERILRIPIVSMVGRVPELSEKEIVMTIKYKDSLGNKFQKKCDLDFNALIEYQVGKPAIYAISDSLKKIQKTMEREERRQR